MHHTHYHPPTNTWFTPSECGNCGATIQAPNAVKLLNADDVDISLRIRGKKPLIRVDELPPEGYYDEDTPSEESCGACNGSPVPPSTDTEDVIETLDRMARHVQDVVAASHLAGLVMGHVTPCEMLAKDLSEVSDKEISLASDLLTRFRGTRKYEKYADRALEIVGREVARRAGQN